MVALSATPLIDVLIVTRNNPSQFQQCIESLLTSTVVPFRLNIYFNDTTADRILSGTVGKEIVSLLQQFPQAVQYGFARSNEGFILPNNRLAAMCDASYLFLLNDDTILRPGWDIALLNPFNTLPRCGITGFSGGLLGEDGVGRGTAGWAHGGYGGVGPKVDYVEGWSLMISRGCLDDIRAYNNLGDRSPVLFARELDFAYGEDSDLCLRAKEVYRYVYCVQNTIPHWPYEDEEFITHLGGQTTQRVCQEPDNPTKERLKASFEANHAYLRARHADYLKNGRVLAQASHEE